MDEIDYRIYLDEFKKFKLIQKKQKQRGLNDFNPLTVVLKYSDEVRLHSRMIGSLLNPKGKHYQETLFLEKFLKTLNLDQWGLDLMTTTVKVEYKDIDLYITDGVKHIIIENKIWADDQPCQIIKYINIVMEENSDGINIKEEEDGYILVDENTLQVVYITPRGKEVPFGHNIDEKGYIYFDGGKDTDVNEALLQCSKRPNTKKYVPRGLNKYKVKYKKITYKDILNWLYSSQKEIRNIINLNESLEQYIDVVKKVNKTYKGNVMSFKEYVQDRQNDMKLQELYELKNEIDNLLSELLFDFFNLEIDGLINVNDKMKVKYKDLIYSKDKCKRWFSKQRQVKDFGTFFKLDDQYLLFVAIGKSYIQHGIVKHDNYEIKILSEVDREHMPSMMKLRKWKNRKLNWYSCLEPKPLLENLDILDVNGKNKFIDKVKLSIKSLNEIDL
jgi:hypothetical protein